MIPGGTWFSPDEIAAKALPGLPGDKRKVSALILDERWAARTAPDGSPLHRKRAGRGGGYEWHSSLLPERARHELVRRGLIAAPVEQSSTIIALPVTPNAAWARFERQSAKLQAEARKRLALIDAVEALQAAGTTKTRAIVLAGADHGASPATINSWFARICGVARPDRLAHLVPETKGGGKAVVIDTELWELYRADWLRFEKPTHAACYWRIERIAKARGIAIPSAKTLQRKIEKDTPPEVILACREGRERVAQIIPAQIRSVLHLHAMETVNIDGHVWDVMVLFPDGEICRPVMVGIQDVLSRKLLSWRVDKTESAVLTRLAFADLFKKFGIPKGCVLDNGRAFASKWITGGAKTRFRFKIRDDEPLGLLPQLGIAPHWATPYHGQAKPVERYWREVCSLIAKTPAFAGAYTGNSPLAKPENYGNAAVPLATFLSVIEREIAAVNAKMGRRTEAGRGGSFDQAFERSIAAGAPVGRATDAQMRLALLAADRVFADRKTGAVNLAGNRYWADGMLDHAGTHLTIRFDPDDLHRSVFAYDAAGALIAELPIWEATGFDDIAGAKAWAKQTADHRRKVRAAVDAEALLEVSAIERALQGLGQGAGQQLGGEQSLPAFDPKVIRPVRARGGAAAALAAQQPDDFMERFAGGMAASERNSAGLRLVE
jgi:transposase InsO family protein